MRDVRNLKSDARQFVKDALTEISGRKPSERTVAATAARIVKAFEPIASKPQSSRAGTRQQDRTARR